MSRDRGVNEWNLLREQFHALVREDSDSIEDILDAQFRRRFIELINRTVFPYSNLALHLRKYTAHRNLPKKRKRTLKNKPLTKQREKVG